MTADAVARVRELQLQVSGLEERLEDMAVKRSDVEAERDAYARDIAALRAKVQAWWAREFTS